MNNCQVPLPAPAGRGSFSAGQIRKRLRIWSCAPVQVPQLCQGVGPSGHPAEDLTGGGPGAAAVIDAMAERGGQVCFGHGEDFFLICSANNCISCTVASQSPKAL